MIIFRDRYLEFLLKFAHTLKNLPAALSNLQCFFFLVNLKIFVVTEQGGTFTLIF